MPDISAMKEQIVEIIEEPPPNTLFILVAENESMILPTSFPETIDKILCSKKGY